VITLFHNGTLVTPSGHVSTSFAVQSGKIIALGAEADGLPADHRENLEGGYVMPGLVDAHVHLLKGGLELAGIPLRACGTPDAFRRAVAEAVARLPKGAWVTGHGWDEQRWGGPLPHRDWVDAISPRHPVLLTRTDLHLGLANSEALRRAGIHADVEDPPGGQFDRDARGLTGIVRDTALAQIQAALPPPSPEILRAALLRAQEHAFSMGITQVHDMGSLGGWTDLATYRELESSGDLKLRVYSAVPLDTHARLAEYVRTEGFGNDTLRWGAVKGFVDGSMGAATAWFESPYAHDPANSGLVVVDLDVFFSQLRDAEAAGLRPVVHAIGDAANAWMLDAYTRLNVLHGPKLRRIEHAQHLRPQDITRFAELGVVASMQPAHLLDDSPWAGRLLGPEREPFSYAIHSLLLAGASVALGTDWPVVPLDPAPGFYAAMHRGPLAWIPGEALSFAQTLHGYTREAALAGPFQNTGHLVPGAYADFCVLSARPEEFTHHASAAFPVESTWVGGARVWTRP